jgi:hypothetical protein
MTRRNVSRRRLTLESLEDRSLLAGDVSVKVAGGNLIVRGDNECNGVLIVQLDDGEYAVAGFEHDGAPTTINGGTDPVIVRGVRHNFNIDLRGGDDLLGIGNDVELLVDLAGQLGFEDLPDLGGLELEIPDIRLRVPKSLIVHTKDGEDGVAFVGDIRYDAIIHTGKHSDGIAIADSNIGDDVILRTLGGEDGVLIEDSDIGGHLNVHTGHDGDTLLVSLSSVRHAVLNSGHGSDAVGISETEFDRELVLLTEQGNDEVVMNLVAARTMVVNTGSGNDDVAMGAIATDHDLILHTGNGSDSVELAGAEIGRNLHVFLASGNDELTIGTSSARRALLHGGSNFDVLNLDDEDFAGDLDDFSFEDRNIGV